MDLVEGRDPALIQVAGRLVLLGEGALRLEPRASEIARQ